LLAAWWQKNLLGFWKIRRAPQDAEAKLDGSMSEDAAGEFPERVSLAWEKGATLLAVPVKSFVWRSINSNLHWIRRLLV